MFQEDSVLGIFATDEKAKGFYLQCLMDAEKELVHQ